MPSVQHDASAGIITQARNILASEAQSLLEAIPTIGESFARAIRLLVDTRGRVIVTGMGKPGTLRIKYLPLWPVQVPPRFISIRQKQHMGTWGW